MIKLSSTSNCSL